MTDEPLKTKTAQMEPGKLTLLDKNAHFMPERTFKQLVDNLKRDGALTSAPLAITRGEKTVVLSGNHRVKAALAAGLKKIPVILIETELTEARQIAIQLSHNALVGEDDPNMLRELYDTLDLLEQRYSGLTDEDLGVLNDPDLAKLAVGLPQHDELTIAFLPDDLTEFQDNLEKLKALSEKSSVIWAKYEHYHQFFEAIFATKEAKKIGNDGIALVVMSEIALAALQDQEAKTDAK